MFMAPPCLLLAFRHFSVYIVCICVSHICTDLSTQSTHCQDVIVVYFWKLTTMIAQIHKNQQSEQTAAATGNSDGTSRLGANQPTLADLAHATRNCWQPGGQTRRSRPRRSWPPGWSRVSGRQPESPPLVSGWPNFAPSAWPLWPRQRTRRGPAIPWCSSASAPSWPPTATRNWPFSW